MEVLDTDVLVIGGGAAGANAALKAQGAGARVLLLVKGLLGKSGCSIFASHLPYYDESTPEKAAARFEYAVRYYNHYLTDQEHVRRMGRYMREEFFGELEALGVYWRRTEDGRVMASPNRVPVAVAHKQGFSGVVIMDKRRREVLARGIPVREETMATSLLTSDGRVVGATALDIKTGQMFAVRAGAVVLATGHSDWLAARSTGTREQSADGIAMVLRAGGELANLEIQWWHVSDLAYPKSWMRLHIYPNPLIGTPETSRLYNAEGGLFYEQRSHSPGSSAPYVEQIRRLGREVQRGRARWDGGYFTGYDHIDPQVLKVTQHQIKVWSKLGLDVARDRLECGITWHMRQGGVLTDPATMATSLRGLLCPGGIGAHYLGGVGPVSYDGKVAGLAAAALAAAEPPPALPQGTLAAEAARVEGLRRGGPGDGPTPAQVKAMIRDMMWEDMGYVKSATSMGRALAGLEKIRATAVPRMRLPRLGRAWNTGWVDALDVLCMLDTCEATVRSALRRTESRGPFYREDYPVVDNARWLARNIVRRIDGRWEHRTEAIPTPYLAPPAPVEPFFEVDY